MTPEEKRIELLENSIYEARRFIKKAESAITAYKKGDGDSFRCSEFASAKRASLDLSKVLVSLRKTIY